MNFLFRTTLIALFLYTQQTGFAFSFSFSEYEDNEAAADSQAAMAADDLASLRCPASFTKMKIATMIGEQHRDNRQDNYPSFITIGEPDWDYRFGTKESVYGPLVDELNQGFGALGLRTYTLAEINEQIAKEEQEAFLNNNIEAALNAATKLQADFILKGIISSRAQTNMTVKVEEVFVTISLTLTDSKGRQLSTAKVSESTFSDADTLGTVQRLVKEQSAKITYELFKNYCQGAN